MEITTTTEEMEITALVVTDLHLIEKSEQKYKLSRQLKVITTVQMNNDRSICCVTVCNKFIFHFQL
jgi:hypothetical protein